MTGKRALFAQARRDLHQEMYVPALYRATPTDDWVAVQIRLLRRSERVGGLPGLEGATMVDLVPRMVFMRDEVDLPARGAIVSIVAGEAWRVGECDPADGISITAHVAPLPVAQTAGFPVPESDA